MVVVRRGADETGVDGGFGGADEVAVHAMDERRLARAISDEVVGAREGARVAVDVRSGGCGVSSYDGVSQRSCQRTIGTVNPAAVSVG